MVTRRDDVRRNVHTLWNVGTVAGLTDGQLLDRYSGRCGAGAELAFAALVERHGAMVFRVCRSVLGDAHEAEDAFQATFLVLARRASSIRGRRSVGSWLYGVALRVSSDARLAKRRRQTRERRAMERATPWHTDAGAFDELGPVLHEELGRLPESLRAPLVLCYLEGMTHEQAAEHLCWPVGTVRSRLARGRERLGGQLIRRGLGPATGLLVACLSERLARAAPDVLANATIRAAVQATASQTAAAGLVPAAVTVLSQGVLKAMFLHKLKLTATALLAVGTLATGVVVGARQATDSEPAPEYPAPATPLRVPAGVAVATLEATLDDPPGPGRGVQGRDTAVVFQEKTTIEALYAELEALLKQHSSVEVATLEDFGIAVRISGLAHLRKARPLLEDTLELGGPIRVRFTPSPQKTAAMPYGVPNSSAANEKPNAPGLKSADEAPPDTVRAGGYGAFPATAANTMEPPSPPNDERNQERRLRDLERKLDQLMKILNETNGKSTDGPDKLDTRPR